MLKKIFWKIIFKALTYNKFNSFQQKSRNTLNHDSIEEEERCLSCMSNQ